MKILAVHGGGDWADASAEYLVIPQGRDLAQDQQSYRRWYEDVFLGKTSRKITLEKPAFKSLVEYLKELGYREPTEKQLQIIADF